MILADKIIELRKKNGWSQEEFAEKLQVSRQSVSRWEGAQSVPDLQKILQMAQLFGVSTDYLLKDEMVEEERVETEPVGEVRRVTMEEAQEYLALREKSAVRLAWSVFLCIASPAALIALGAFAGAGEETMGFFGLVLMLVMIALGVIGIITANALTAKYDFLEKEVFETAYGVSGMVKEKQTAFHGAYLRGNLLGIALCILSPVAVLFGAFLQDEVFAALGTVLLLLMVGYAVVNFISVGMRWSSYEKLLQEGEYTREEKKRNPLREKVAGIYWPLVLAGYLAWSFAGAAWGRSWIVWPIAGIAFAAVVQIVEALQKKD